MQAASVQSMKFLIGSRPLELAHESRPVGQLKAAEASAGVSLTKSQWPTSWVAVSPRFYGEALPPGRDWSSSTTPSIASYELLGKVAQPSRPPPRLAV